MQAKTRIQNLKNYKRWTDKEIEYLKENYGKITNKNMGEKLNRTKKAIRMKLLKLGILLFTKENDNYLRDKNGRFIKGHHSKVCFKKGNIPWNKLILNKKKIIFLYTKEIESPKKISKIFNCSVRPIYRILRESNIDTTISTRLKNEFRFGKRKKPIGMFGKKVPITRRLQISKTMKEKIKKGEIIPHSRGKTMMDYEPLKRISEKAKLQYKLGLRIHPLKGKKRSEEFKENMKKIWKDKIEGGYISPSIGKRHSKKTINKIKERRANQIFPSKDTSIEIKIQNFLKQLGIDFFTHQYIKNIEHGYQCDILIPSINLVIECDGDYWHKYPIGREIDKIRTSELIEKGFKVLRLWESEIKVMDLNKFEERLKNV